jgi:hypothetical protein
MRRHLCFAALLVSLGSLCTILRGAQTAQISTDASSHLTEIISVLEKEWLQGAIPPVDLVTEPAEVVVRAVKWLRGA